VSSSCGIRFLWKNESLQVLKVFRRFCACIRNRITVKKYRKSGSVLNVGAKNSNNVAFITAGSWSGGPLAAQPGRQYRHVLLLCISVAFIRVISLKHSHRFQVGILVEGVSSRN
jgi:hypothetical protein